MITSKCFLRFLFLFIFIIYLVIFLCSLACLFSIPLFLFFHVYLIILYIFGTSCEDVHGQGRIEVEGRIYKLVNSRRHINKKVKLGEAKEKNSIII